MLPALIVSPSAVADRGGDVARYILPPGNYGGLPTTVNSRDQLPLYTGLTPFRGHVTANDINRLFIPENFAPVGASHEEQTGRAGLRLIYDSYGIPHVYGKTHADVAFGAGWTTRAGSRPPHPDRTRSGPGCGRGRARDQRVLARHERPIVRYRARKPRRSSLLSATSW